MYDPTVMDNEEFGQELCRRLNHLLENEEARRFIMILHGTRYVVSPEKLEGTGIIAQAGLAAVPSGPLNLWAAGLGGFLAGLVGPLPEGALMAGNVVEGFSLGTEYVPYWTPMTMVPICNNTAISQRMAEGTSQVPLRELVLRRDQQDPSQTP